MNQADSDTGERPGTSTEDNAEIGRLEQENRELRRANETLPREAVARMAGGGAFFGTGWYLAQGAGS